MANFVGLAEDKDATAKAAKTAQSAASFAESRGVLFYFLYHQASTSP